MARRHHYKRKHAPVELEVTTFLNLMVVLIPFLLVTTVFTKVTIQELNLPTQSSDVNNPDQPPIIIEVILRRDSLEIGDGKSVIKSIPMVDKKHDFQKLSEGLLRLKKQHGEKEDISILVEPDVEYETVIHAMDAVKSAEIKQAGQKSIQRVVLFPEISIGDAP